MRKLTAKLITFAAAVLAAGALLGCAVWAAPSPEETELSPSAEAETAETAGAPAARRLAVADQSEHPALMSTDGWGDFRPEAVVTRGQLCRMLYPMLDGLTDGSAAFSDLEEGDAYYTEAAALYNAGLLMGMLENGALCPNLYVTRPMLTGVLAKLARRLDGEEAQRVKTLAKDVSEGVTSAAGTAGGEKEPIRRQEMAVILERLAGREPDETALFLRECIPGDITREDYAWACIADAVTEGPVEPMEPGVHRAYDWLYATWDDGSIVTDMDYGVWTFGLDGRYTTGDAELDGYLADVLKTIGAAELSDGDALAAAYLHVKYNYEYLVRPEDMETIPVGETGWEYDRAVRFFRYGGGTCYGFAAAFGLLARVLGRNAYVVAAEVNEYYAPHGFVVIPEDGTDWIYDVELEATRQERHWDLELFRIENHTIYNYWYRADWSDT